jgi:hypothetical protein
MCLPFGGRRILSEISGQIRTVLRRAQESYIICTNNDLRVLKKIASTTARRPRTTRGSLPAELMQRHLLASGD